MLLNSPLIHEQASFLAERLRSEAGTEPKAQVVHAWKLAYSAEPSPREVEQSLAFLQKQAELFKNGKAAPNQPDAGRLALTNFCQALLSTNRFMYVD